MIANMNAKIGKLQKTANIKDVSCQYPVTSKIVIFWEWLTLSISKCVIHNQRSYKISKEVILFWGYNTWHGDQFDLDFWPPDLKIVPKMSLLPGNNPTIKGLTRYWMDNTKHNKRPMDHTAHLRNQFKSMNTFERSYDYIYTSKGRDPFHWAFETIQSRQYFWYDVYL